jgi:ribokinase
VTTPSPRLLVVGGANLDQIALTPRLPSPGETVLASGYVESAGGKAANLASAAAAWGIDVTMVARVGRDSFGDALVEAFVEEGVDVDFVERDDAGTGLGIVFMDDDGTYQTIVVPRANARLAPADVERLPAALWERVGALALALEAPLPVTLAAAGAAAARGLPVVLNAAPAEGMDDALWPLVSHLVVNEHEAALLTGRPAVTPADAGAAAMDLLERLDPERARAAVITLGAHGAVYVARAATVETIAAPQVDAIDTLGAGDTFVGVFAAEIARGKPLRQGVTSACHAGAVAVTVRGARARVTPDRVARQSARPHTSQRAEGVHP